MNLEQVLEGLISTCDHTLWEVGGGEVVEEEGRYTLTMCCKMLN